MKDLLLSNPAPGNMIMEKYGISELELYRYVQKGELNPMSFSADFIPRPDRRTKSHIDGLKGRLGALRAKKRHDLLGPKDLLYFSLEDKTPGFDVERTETEIEYIQNEINKYDNDPRDPYDWTTYNLPSGKKEADEVLRFISDCYYRLDEVEKLNDGEGPKPFDDHCYFLVDNSNRKSLTRDQKNKIAVIEMAISLWEKDPTITIATMAKHPEIIKVCKGKKYHLNTIRNWIKPYNPNPNPGRRKNKR